MKRITVFISVLIMAFTFSSNVSAQFSASTKLISGGVSMGLYGRYYHDWGMTKMSIPPIGIQYETGLGKDAGLGDLSSAITVGAYAAYHSQHYSKDITIYEYSYDIYKDYKYLMGGIVGSFHMVNMANSTFNLNIDPKKLDVYLSVKSGLVLEIYRSDYDGDPYATDAQNGTILIKENNPYFYLAPAIGARYYFLDNIAVFAEIGRVNLSNMFIGLSLNL